MWERLTYFLVGGMLNNKLTKKWFWADLQPVLFVAKVMDNFVKIEFIFMDCLSRAGWSYKCNFQYFLGKKFFCTKVSEGKSAKKQIFSEVAS